VDGYCASITGQKLQPPWTTVDVLDVEWPFMLNAAIFDAMPITTGSLLLVLCSRIQGLAKAILGLV
jgi:hypothetical protein